MAKGMLSKPPSGTRVSPGVYRSASGSLSNSASGGKKQQKKKKAQASAGMSANANALIGQQETGDLALGNTANNLTGRINDAYANPFDRNALIKAPWEQGDTLQGMQTQYQDEVYNQFARTAEPRFQQEIASFDSNMAQRGIPMGSELYTRMRKELLDTQEGQRQNIRGQALTGAADYASNWNNIGTQNFQNQYGFELDQRNMPLGEYSALMGARSGLGQDYLDFSQGKQLQNDQQAHDKWMMQNQPRGGGGGGGGAGPMWAQYGFSSPMEFDAYQEEQRRANSQWDYENDPRYKTPKSASTGAILGGGILGNVASGVGAGLGKGIFNWFGG